MRGPQNLPQVGVGSMQATEKTPFRSNNQNLFCFFIGDIEMNINLTYNGGSCTMNNISKL